MYVHPPSVVAAPQKKARVFLAPVLITYDSLEKLGEISHKDFSKCLRIANRARALSSRGLRWCEVRPAQ